MLYLDHAASSPLCEDSLKVVCQSLAEDYANPSSAHKLGTALSKKIDATRDQFIKAIKGQKGRLVFTGSATEANNTVIKGIKLGEDASILYSQADHPSLVMPAKRTCKRLLEIPLKSDGSIDRPMMLEKIDDSVEMVLLILVNNQTGNWHPVEDIAREIKQKNKSIHVHVDAVQGLGKVPFSVEEGNIDSATFSGHKIGASKGVGALWIKNGVEVSPLLDGGGHEYGLRSSTLAAPLIFSFGAALTYCLDQREKGFENLKNLNRTLRERLSEVVDGIEFPYPLDLTSPFILTFLVPGLSSDILLRHLEQKDIFLSSSSACSSKAKSDNPVYEALHIPKEKQKFVLRASFGYDFNQQLLEEFVTSLSSVMGELAFLIKR